MILRSSNTVEEQKARKKLEKTNSPEEVEFLCKPLSQSTVQLDLIAVAHTRLIAHKALLNPKIFEEKEEPEKQT